MTSVTRIEFAPEGEDDFDRILGHLPEHEINNATARVQDIIAAIDVLERSPLIGRPVENDLPELVIGRGASGYVALYRYAEAAGTILVLAIRGQQESGYRRDIGGGSRGVWLRALKGSSVLFGKGEVLFGKGEGWPPDLGVLSGDRPRWRDLRVA